MPADKKSEYRRAERAGSLAGSLLARRGGARTAAVLAGSQSDVRAAAPPSQPLNATCLRQCGGGRGAAGSLPSPQLRRGRRPPAAARAAHAPLPSPPRDVAPRMHPALRAVKSAPSRPCNCCPVHPAAVIVFGATGTVGHALVKMLKEGHLGMSGLKVGCGRKGAGVGSKAKGCLVFVLLRAGQDAQGAPPGHETWGARERCLLSGAKHGLQRCAVKHMHPRMHACNTHIATRKHATQQIVAVGNEKSACEKLEKDMGVHTM